MVNPADFDLSKLKIFPNRWIVFCDLCGLTVWLYALLKVFIFDVDTLIIEPLGPEWSWLADFRLIIFIAVLAVTAVVVGRRRFLGLCIYVVAFPLILIGWKLCFLIVRSGSWVLGISFMNWFMSIFSDLFYKLIVTAAYAVSISLILFASDKLFITCGMALLTLAVIATFVRMAVNSFRAPRVLAVYRKFFGFLAKGREDFKVEEAGPKGVKLALMPEEGKVKYAEALRMRILLNRGALFFATRLRDFQKSQAIALSGLASALNLVVISSAAFAVLYAGAQRIDPTSISSEMTMEAFDYVYLSFNNMIFSDVAGVAFVDNLSRGLSMLQRFLTFTMLGLFVGVIMSIRGRRYQQELEETIEEIKSAGGIFEKSIVNYYGYSGIDEAVEDLRHIQKDMADFIVRISAGIKP